MSVLVALPPTEVRRWYPEKGLAHDLEDLIIKRGLTSIGSVDSWKRRVNALGQERLGSLDMSQSARAYRSLDIQNLSIEELKKIHTHELKFMTRFIIGPIEMRIILKRQDIPDQKYLDEKQGKEMIKINDDNRPSLVRKFEHLYIPPYFYYDYDFDGMRYHHAWDLKVHGIKIKLSMREGKPGRASSEFKD